MKSWTRTLNLDDAHSLLALAQPGLAYDDWAKACHRALPELSMPRRRELIRIVRDGFLEFKKDDRIAKGLFIRLYAETSADAQLDLVDAQWAMSHPLTLVAVEALVAPALKRTDRSVQLQAVEGLVSRTTDTGSAESLRKTRTVLLGAMEGVGTLTTRGTGQHRSLWASRGTPNPLAFGYLVLRELAERGTDAMMASEVTDSSLPVRLTQCGRAHAEHCLAWSLRKGILAEHGDEIGVP